MDYVMIAAILTFFVLFFLKNKEGYTDSYINTTVEKLKKTSGNIDKTINNIKDLTNTNNTSSSLKIDVLDALEQINESLKVNGGIDPDILTKIELYKNNLTDIQDNIMKINKKSKEALDAAYVPIVRLNETKPIMVPLLTALDFVSADISTIKNLLQTIPDKKRDKN